MIVTIYHHTGIAEILAVTFTVLTVIAITTGITLLVMRLRTTCPEHRSQSEMYIQEHSKGHVQGEVELKDSNLGRKIV